MKKILIILLTFLAVNSCAMKRDRKLEESQCRKKVCLKPDNKQEDINQPVETTESEYDVPRIFILVRDENTKEHSYYYRKIQSLLDKNATLTYQTTVKNKVFKTSIFHWLAKQPFNHQSILNLIFSKVEKMPNRMELINYSDQNGNTALHMAVESRNISLMKELIKSGCSVNVLNNIFEFPFPSRNHAGESDYFFSYTSKEISRVENVALGLLVDAGIDLLHIKDRSYIAKDCEPCDRFVKLIEGYNEKRKKQTEQAINFLDKKKFSSNSFLAFLPRELQQELIFFLMNRVQETRSYDTLQKLMLDSKSYLSLLWPSEIREAPPGKKYIKMLPKAQLSDLLRYGSK